MISKVLWSVTPEEKADMNRKLIHHRDTETQRRSCAICLFILVDPSVTSEYSPATARSARCLCGEITFVSGFAG